jgi:FAD/FMN-containing dehydrogenase
MSKIAHYLQEHLVGEVMTSVDARRYFSTDGSILTAVPSLIVYPRNENDIRKTARFCWQLAERGRIIPITARGLGTDTSGAALGNGIITVFPAHMNRILELDTKNGSVTVEPGINFGKLQQTLKTHSKFLPPSPAAIEYSTIGGTVANNSGGQKSVKYGSMRDYVQSLRVVLANGEVIDVQRLTKKDLSKKLGLATFEGEIYRAVDTLIEENRELINSMITDTGRNSTGYDLVDIKRKDGTFDLTPLFVGSQGTLGIISEVSLSSEPYNPDTTLIMATYASLTELQDAVNELKASKFLPSSLEMVNDGLLKAVNDLNPNQLKDLLPNPLPEYILFVEYDISNERQHKKTVKRALKILEKAATNIQKETDPEIQQKLWKIRQSSSSYISHNDGPSRAIPIIDSASVPSEKLGSLIDGINSLFKVLLIKPVAIWGRAGDGTLHVQPHLNLAQVGDRQKALRLIDEYYKMVIKLGGSISASEGDGRLRAPYLELQFGPEVYALMQKIKTALDPYNILNPGVKFGTSLEDVKKQLRTDYSYGHLYDHMPRS